MDNENVELVKNPLTKWQDKRLSTNQRTERAEADITKGALLGKCIEMHMLVVAEMGDNMYMRSCEHIVITLHPIKPNHVFKIAHVSRDLKNLTMP